MKIKRINVRRENMELTRPYTIAYKTTTHTECCIVEVEAENGMIGYGASNPSKWVVGEDLDACMAKLSDEFIGRFIGKDILTLPALCDELHALLPMNPGAKGALDIGFHDLFGKVLGVSIVDYFGQQINSLATSITIGIKDVAGTLEEAQEYFDGGFKILKVKLGHSLEEDLERLIKLREKFGNSMGIRVDANQGYSAEQVHLFHAKTQDLDLELVEQPTPQNDIEMMRNFPEEIRATIAADETLVDAKAALNLSQSPKACGIFNIKLMKCGGIHQARRIASIAELADIDLMWGCNDESIISITAALHTAFASPNTKYIDLDGSLDLARDVVKGGFILENGMMRPNGKAGLGLEGI